MIAPIYSHATRVTYIMRLVREGDSYGRDMCLTHDDPRPVVEFYDSRHVFDRAPDGTPLGQFVSRYYAETIAEGTTGLNLDGGIPAWTIDAEGMREARAQIARWTQEGQPGDT